MFRNTNVHQYTHMHAITMRKEAMDLKESEEGYTGGIEEKEEMLLYRNLRSKRNIFFKTHKLTLNQKSMRVLRISTYGILTLSITKWYVSETLLFLF